MDKQRENEICKVFEDVVKKHPDATAKKGLLPDDIRFILLEFWQAAQDEMQPEIDRLTSNQCSGHFRIGCNYMSGCNTICNKCGHVHNADTGLAYIQQLNAANQRNKELQSENEDCRNLMRIKQEQNDAFNQRIQELLDLVEVVERRNKQLEERIRVADAEEPVAQVLRGDTPNKLFLYDIEVYNKALSHGTKLYLHAQIPTEVVGSFFAGIEASEGILKIE